MPFFDGGLPVLRERLNYKVLNGNFVYYLSSSAENNDCSVTINLIRCNLLQPEIETFPINLGINANVYSFLNADDSSILVEKRGQIIGGNRPFSLDSFSLNGEMISSLFVAEFPASSGFTKVMDYARGPDSKLILYRFNYPSQQYSIEFLDEGLQVESSINLHGDDYQGAPFIYPPGSSSIFMVLDSRISTQPNYRLVEIDLDSKSIIHDTLFVFPEVLYTAAPPLYSINDTLGEILLYGMADDIPYVHRINVINKFASFDSINFPEDSFFGRCDYFHIDFNGTEYYTVAIDNIPSSGEGLNGYCVGKLDFPTSIATNLENKAQFTLFPNPAQQFISLSNLPSENLSIQLSDLQGRVLYTENSNHQTTLKLPIDGLCAGVYFVSVRGASGVNTI